MEKDRDAIMPPATRERMLIERLENQNRSLCMILRTIATTRKRDIGEMHILNEELRRLSKRFGGDNA